MSANSFATSTNVVVSSNVNSHNARIHFDPTGVAGWDISAGVLTGATELRRSIMDPDNKTAPASAKDSDTVISFEYDSTQLRSVKKRTALTTTAARIVYAPSAL